MIKLLPAFLLFIFSCGAGPVARPGFSFLIQGLEPLRDNRAHRWADISMIVEDAGDHVKIISFPRDTLAEIPGRGMWLLNAIYYNLDTVGRGHAWEWFSNNIYPVNDGQVVATAEQMAAAVHALSIFAGDSELIKRIIRDFNYIEDWVRHRSKLGMEISRQVRIHSFIKYLILQSKKDPLPDPLVKKMFSVIVPFLEASDLTAADLFQVYRACLDKGARFYIWPGEYRPIQFNYTWYADTHYTYILDDVKTSALKPYDPNWVYDIHDFFKREGAGPRVRVNTNLFAVYRNFK